MGSTGPPGHAQPQPARESEPAREPDSSAGVSWAALGLLAAIAIAALYVIFFNDGGDGEQDAATAIEAAVTRAAMSTDPAICDQVFSDRWLAENFASATQSDVERCREATTEDPDRKAASVSVTDITVADATATATAEMTGGNVGAATMRLALVDADRWRLDHLEDISIDRDRYLAAQRVEIEAGDVPEVAKPILHCMVDFAERRVSAAQIERSVLAGNEDFYGGAYDSCRPEFRSFAFSPAVVGGEAGYTRAQTACISRAASETFDDSDLEALFTAFATEEEPPSERLRAKNDAVVSYCVS